VARACRGALPSLAASQRRPRFRVVRITLQSSRQPHMPAVSAVVAARDTGPEHVRVRVRMGPLLRWVPQLIFEQAFERRRAPPAQNGYTCCLGPATRRSGAGTRRTMAGRRAWLPGGAYPPAHCHLLRRPQQPTSASPKTLPPARASVRNGGRCQRPYHPGLAIGVASVGPISQFGSAPEISISPAPALRRNWRQQWVAQSELEPTKLAHTEWSTFAAHESVARVWHHVAHPWDRLQTGVASRTPAQVSWPRTIAAQEEDLQRSFPSCQLASWWGY
jgi:hypothetical protein